MQRFIDREDKKEIYQGADFKLRQHGMPLVRIVMGFIIVLLATIMPIGQLIADLLYLKTGEPAPNVQEIMFMLGVIMVGACAAGLIGVVLIYKIKETIHAVEFQSLVFASSMRLKSDFCLVLFKKGTAIYADENFYDLFKKFDKQPDPYKKLLASKGLSKADQTKLKKSLKDSKNATLNFKLDNKKYKMTLEHLSRPEGFFLLKAKKV